MTDLVEIETKMIAKSARSIAIGNNGDDAVWVDLAYVDWEEKEPGSDEIIVTMPRVMAIERNLL